jgi:type IV pilus assembly protein PilW
MCARRQPAARQRGFSLIELMVSLVIALLVSIAATGAAIFFDALQRQGVGTSVATVSVSNALAAMKEDASQAGLGFLGAPAYTCTQLNYSIRTSIVSSSTFSPLQVTRDAQGFDQLDVAYGSNIVGGTTALLAGSSDATKAQLSTFLPVSVQSPAQTVLLSPAPGSSNTTCTVRSVTGVTAAVGSDPQTLAFDASGPLNNAAFASPAKYVAKDQVTLLGGFVWHRYRVAGGDLVVDLLDAQRSSVAVVRNVVAFRVQYGIAAAPAPPPAPRSTTVVSWTDATGSWSTLSPATIGQVRALRIGIVTRSANVEKADASGLCFASTSIPTPFGGLAVLPSNDPRACFRYRLDIAVIPLRNVNLGLGV